MESRARFAVSGATCLCVCVVQPKTNFWVRHIGLYAAAQPRITLLLHGRLYNSYYTDVHDYCYMQQSAVCSRASQAQYTAENSTRLLIAVGLSLTMCVGLSYTVNSLH